MKQTLLSILSFCLALCSLWAQQNFAVSSRQISIQGTAHQELAPAITVRNLTSRPLELSWELAYKNLPSEWTAQICDKTCHTLDAKTPVFVLAPYEATTLQVNFSANGAEGMGLIDLQLMEPKKRTESARIAFTATAQHSHLPAARGSSSAQRIYPNPVEQAYFMLQDDDNTVRQIAVYDALGLKVSEFAVNGANERYYIHQLPEGRYFLRLLDEKGRTIRTTRMEKKNP